MRFIAILLIGCLVLPLFPSKAVGQLLLNPSEVSGITAAQSAGIQNVQKNPGTDLSRYIPYGNIPREYKLGPGDQLEAHLIVGDNALALDYTFLINPEGKIFFPNVGEIYLSGFTIDEARAKLINTVKTVYKENFSLSLMLSSPRLVKIYITGQIENPGLYSIFNGAKISEIVNYVGIGRGGSKRYVIVKRKNKIIDVDLYKILYKGGLASDLNIEMGDSIEIPPMASVRITIMGEVPRPGQYELKEGERLEDALAMAGYVGVNSALSEVAYLKREKEKENFENYKLNLYDMFLKNDESQNIALTDGDIISIPSIKAYAYVYGEIGRGGRFDYIPGNKLSDYINMAGGPTPRANLGAVTVTRQENGKPKVYRLDASEILYRGVKNSDIEIMAGDVISVPGNFFYFSDFASFANTVLLAVTLYSTFVR